MTTLGTINTTSEVPVLARISGSSGAAGADLTLQKLTANSAGVTTTTLSASVMSTTGVGVGLWLFRYFILYQSGATTNGIGFGINHTGTVNSLRAMWRHVTTGTTAATGVGDSFAAADQLVEGKTAGSLASLNTVIGPSSGVDTANLDVPAILEGLLDVTVTGTLELKIASENAGTAVRLANNTCLELVKIG